MFQEVVVLRMVMVLFLMMEMKVKGLFQLKVSLIGLHKHPYIDKKMVKINFQGRGSKNIIAIDNWNLINNFIYDREKKEDFFNYVRYANPNVSKIIKLRNGNNSCGFKIIINKST